MNRLCTKIEPSVPLPRVRTPRAVPDRKGCYRNTLGYHGNETLRHQYLRRTRCLALLLPLLLVNRALFISSKLCSSILSCCLGSNRVHAAYRRYNVFRLSSNYVQTGYNASPRCRLVEATHSLSLSLFCSDALEPGTSCPFVVFLFNPLPTLPLDVSSRRWPRFSTLFPPSCVHGLTINALILGLSYTPCTRRLAYTTEVNELWDAPLDWLIDFLRRNFTDLSWYYSVRWYLLGTSERMEEIVAAQ